MEKIRSNLIRALHDEEISWNILECSASEIILFGSRAAGVARIDSDWDLLCIGNGTPVHRKKIDLNWISPLHVRSDLWLGSELASHVAVYGYWLAGEDSWSHGVTIPTEIIHRKCRTVHFECVELARLWNNIIPSWRAEHLRKIRRNVQRLYLLADGKAVPPTRMLDDIWVQSGNPLEDLKFLCQEVERFQGQQIERA